MGRHRGRFAALVAAGGLLALGPATAGAATTLGQSPPSAGAPQPCDTSGLFGDLIQLSDSTGNPYTVPEDGVITAWRTSLSAGTMIAKLRVFALNQTETAVTPVGESAVEAIAAGGRSEFPTRVPVAAGELLGLALNAGADDQGCATTTSSAEDVVGVALSGPIGQSETLSTAAPNVLINVAATLEPDADHDGFGDETQDACTSDPLRQRACKAPDTEFTKKPKKQVKRRTAKFAFISHPPGAAFECKLSGVGIGYARCTSPLKLKKLTKGKHVFSVRAVANGTVDPTPAKAKFKVKQKKHHKGK